MADAVILTVGVLQTDLVPVALMMTRKGGTCVVTAMTPLSQMTVPMSLTEFVNRPRRPGRSTAR